MNRKAKRNKYKKLQRELERKIEMYKAKTSLEHCFSKDVKVQQISCFKPIEEYSRLPVEVVKEYYQKEVARQIAEEILKHQDYFKITDTGFGYRRDNYFIPIGREKKYLLLKLSVQIVVVKQKWLQKQDI